MPVGTDLTILLVAPTNENQIKLSCGRRDQSRNQPTWLCRAGRSSVFAKAPPTSKPNSRSLDVFAPFKYLTAIAAIFLIVFGTLPVFVSALYGGNPPPHVARLLDKQMEVFATVAPIIFAPFKAFASNEKPPDDKK
jgi:hypothetical protein